MARCSTCNVTFNVKWDGIKAVKSHMEGINHKQKISVLTHSSNLNQFFQSKSSKFDDKVTTAELTQVYHGVRSHHSYLSIECGNKVCSSIFLDSMICKNIRLGHSKLESIVQNILAPYALESIISIAKYLPFNVSNKDDKKLFPIAIRYFNIANDEQPIVHALIDFKQTWGETSEEVFNVIKSTMEYTITI